MTSMASVNMTSRQGAPVCVLAWIHLSKCKA